MGAFLVWSVTLHGKLYQMLKSPMSSRLKRSYILLLRNTSPAISWEKKNKKRTVMSTTLRREYFLIVYGRIGKMWPTKIHKIIYARAEFNPPSECQDRIEPMDTESERKNVIISRRRCEQFEIPTSRKIPIVIENRSAVMWRVRAFWFASNLPNRSGRKIVRILIRAIRRKLVECVVFFFVFIFRP